MSGVSQPATNKYATHCRLCGNHIAAGAGRRWWCEDGSPIHCTRHFDEGGWEVSCANEAACARRVATQAAERVAAADTAAAKRQAVADAQRAREAAWRALRAEQLAAYPASTSYGPQAYMYGGAWGFNSTTPLELVAEADLTDPRWPTRAWMPALFRGPGVDGLLEISRVQNPQTWHVANAAAADKMRRDWLASEAAVGRRITREHAAESVDSTHIGDDQRRMYELVIADADDA